MRGEVVRSEIRLGFHDAADALRVNQIFAEQFPGNDDRVPVVE
jgi:hypothetical protein